MADGGVGPRHPVVVVLMGVSGSGKSTVAGVLHGRLGWPLCEGDALHPPQKVAKMAGGDPLTDADRWPWLALIRDWIDERVAAGQDAIVTCSALKRSYRDTLRSPHVLFAYLAGTREQLLTRLTGRHGHFMPADLLDSQLDTLEEPDPDECATEIRIDASPAVAADQILDRLGV